jgi:DNA invertase Pin-like site-specific DNA recombinase
MKIIMYRRVSTAEQVEHFGLAVQEQKIKAWAKAGRHRIVGSYADEGKGGGNGLETRPELAEALARVEAGEADALVVSRLDRLARDLLLQETWITKLEQAGRQVISVEEPEPEGEDHMRTLVRQILGAIAQYEKAVIRGRMAAGRAAKAERGGFAYGSPPLGYRAEGKELVVDEAEQATVRRITELRDSGLSWRQIQDALEAEGIPPKRGGRWHPVTIARAYERNQTKIDM